MTQTCADSGLTISACYCLTCGALRERQSQLRVDKAHVLLADRPERDKDRELLTLDEELRHLARVL